MPLAPPPPVVVVFDPPAPVVVVVALELAVFVEEVAEAVAGGRSACARGAKVKHVAANESIARERVLIETSSGGRGCSHARAGRSRVSDTQMSRIRLSRQQPLRPSR
jgi:hypothetical protein